MSRKSPKKSELEMKKKKEIVLNEVGSLKRELEQEREKANEYLKKLEYLQAEFENYQKRSMRAISDGIQLANQRLITELLVILDELGYAINASKSGKNKDALVQGVKMTQKKFYDILVKEGLSEVTAIGEPFNPLVHEALERLPRGENGDGEEIVVEEVRKGFAFKGKVIRPSLVKVAYEPRSTNNSK